MYNIAKKILFALDAERVHELGVAAIPLLSKFMPRHLMQADARLSVNLDGCTFPNPIGLAAGFDKGAVVYQHLHRFGFGFVEVGTLTPRSQDGNPKPRLFRAPAERALLNRMGFNNHGVEGACRHLQRCRSRIPLGINLGKNKDTPLERAAEDYLGAFKALAPFGDYFVVNVSSPNTPNLRALQDKAALDEIFAALNEANQQYHKPIWLKIAPDLADAALEDIVGIVEKRKIYGLIATNTTLDKTSLPAHLQKEAGGVSGRPVREGSDRVLGFMTRRLLGRCRFIGVGGICEVEDVVRKISLGADLVQVYTGWIYHGPAFPGYLCRGLLAYLEKHSMILAELKGSALRN